MLQQTLNGRDILILRNWKSGGYILIYEGRTIETDERPVTDQELERINGHRNINRGVSINTDRTVIILGNVLVELLLPLLPNLN
jgi:hypothetical protein